MNMSGLNAWYTKIQPCNHPLLPSLPLKFTFMDHHCNASQQCVNVFCPSFFKLLGREWTMPCEMKACQLTLWSDWLLNTLLKELSERLGSWYPKRLSNNPDILTAKTTQSLSSYFWSFLISTQSCYKKNLLCCLYYSLQLGHRSDF